MATPDQRPRIPASGARANGVGPGQAPADPPASSPPATPSTMQELGRELTALARTLSGPLHRLSVRSGDAEIAVEWDRAAAGGEGPAPAASASAEPEEDSGTAVAVRSPLVGTYYAAPAPDAAPFVTVGDEVEAGQTLAIVEAMKMMNSVVATEAGTVAEILVSNGQAVEFDQALILLLPPEVTP